MSSRAMSTTARPRRNRATSRMASRPRAVGYARRRAWRRKLATKRAEASSPSATRIQRWPAVSRQFMTIVESRFSARERRGFEIEKLHRRGRGRSASQCQIWRSLLDGGLDEAEFLDATVQRADGETERARGLFLVVSEAIESPRDQIALGLIERRQRVVHCRGGQRVGLGGEIGQVPTPHPLPPPQPP